MKRPQHQPQRWFGPILAMWLGWAGCPAHAENALSRIEQSCAKLPSPQAQAECRQKQAAALAAFEREHKKNEPGIDFKKEGAAKKNELCFTRKATGELTCPN